MRRKLVVLAMTAVIAAFGVGTALAAVGSSVSIGYNSTTEKFHGKVMSSNSECTAGRTVKVFKKTSSGRLLEGKTTSTSTGRWKVEVMHAHGHYFAVVPAQKVMNTSCGRAKSKTIDVM